MNSYAISETCTESAPKNADEVQDRLNAGSQHFADWIAENSNTSDFETQTGLVGPQHVAEQRPFAAVVGCSDARFPLRTALGQPFNSLFEIRVAGNVLGDECLGSIDYALQHLPSVKSVVVLGHTYCGAVTAAVDSALRTSATSSLEVSIGLRAILQRLFSPIFLTSTAWKELAEQMSDECHSPSLKQLVETAVYVNAASAAYSLKAQVSKNQRSDVCILYGAFDLKDYRIRSPQVVNGDSNSLSIGLSHAPVTAPELKEIALAAADAISKRTNSSEDQ